ncbi:neuronal acetylcholine receptor subunit alpha-6-like isoform X1 [Branchiostoma lanceolatum]|uniref:neuronal acetylcholine receptor subunit alpha-6-like isoform X1 n=1 Tax=Branchiostoma lanceolatum TaxID=7740 RepID=UPI003456019E
MKLNPVIGLVLLSTLYTVTFAYQAEERLLDALKSGYRKDVIPMVDNRTAVDVEVSVTVASILGVDDKKQELKTLSWLTMDWRDYRLRWNPRQYDNLQKINVPSDLLWRPDLLPYNSRTLDSGIDLSVDAIVYSNGRVTFIPKWLTQTSCSFDATYYPFDEQTCSMKLGSWTHHAGEIDLRLNRTGSTTKMLEHLDAPPSWEVVNASASRNVVTYPCCPKPYVDVTFSLYLRRVPGFLHVFNLIAPTVLFLAAAVLGFYLPSDTGSRTLLGVVSLLGVTLVSLLNYGHFPLSGHATTPIIGQFYALAVILVGLFTVVTIGLWGIHHRAADLSPVPGWLKAVLSGLARVCCIRYPAASTDKDGVPLGSIVAGDGPAEGGAASTVSEIKKLKCMQDILQNVHAIAQTVDEQSRNTANQRNWKNVALVIDRILLTAFILTALIGTLAILLQLA